MKKMKLIFALMAIALCFAGCKENKTGEAVKPTDAAVPTVMDETDPDEEIAETASATESGAPEDQSDSAFAGGLLEDSTQSTEENQDDADEPGADVETEDLDVTAPVEETEVPTQGEESKGESVIPENDYNGDLLEPPAEGSDGVL